mgnify:CR=1 FL=1
MNDNKDITKEEVKKVIRSLLSNSSSREKLVELLYWISYSSGQDRQAANNISGMVTSAYIRSKKKAEMTTA